VIALSVEELQARMIKEFAAMRSQLVIEFAKLVNANGSEKAVLSDDEKMKELLEKQNKLSGAHDAVNAPAITSLTDGNKLKAPGTSSEKAKQDSERASKALAEFRKEYRDSESDLGLDNVLQKNLETFSKTFQMGLRELKEDLYNKIEHEGDRIIKYIKGPSSRLKDKV
jgi:hypothetical protein